jgi:ATP-binding cassette, subfamily B, bacterial MsbA
MYETTISTIKKLIAPHIKRLFIVAIVSIVHISMGLGLITIASKSSGNFLVFIFSALAIGVFLSFFEDFLTLPISIDISRSITKRSFKSIINLPSKTVTLDLLNKTISEGNWISDSIFSLLRAFLRRFLQIFIFSITLLIIDINLFFSSILIFPLVLLPGILIGKKCSDLRRKIFKNDGDIHQFQTESILNINIIKAFNRSEFINTIHNKKLNSLLKAQLHHRRWQTFLAPISFLALLSGGIILYFYGTYLLSTGSIETGTLRAFFTALALLYSPLSGLGQDILLLWSFRNSPTMELIKNNTKEPDRKDIVNEISFNKIDFGFNNLLLKDFSLTAKSGEIIGITGSNGSGKTSIAHLLLGIITPQKGSIKVDSYHAIPSSKQIGYLDQTGSLFTEDLHFNISLGRDGEENIMHHFNSNQNFIPGFLVSNKNISGGERRKISLARALFNSPKLLILDEPEDSMDKNSISIIRKLLMEAKSNGSIIILITHNNSLLSICTNTIQIGSKSN